MLELHRWQKLKKLNLGSIVLLKLFSLSVQQMSNLEFFAVVFGLNPLSRLLKLRLVRK